ncbi:uncharacterized protein N7482_009809 [Penicillium canariense]|uniref:Uncharacterized protein n=1 Tax=Penicillium canariense TaxID=189055 RepID=A0A9W9HS09_9EURO|nr:uncharacterized protein N7482_009809 [Penicillium canariense]KAJ5153331.1 hypothetical protein N7482_009809 [Penicillium canariense]
MEDVQNSIFQWLARVPEDCLVQPGGGMLPCIAKYFCVIQESDTEPGEERSDAAPTAHVGGCHIALEATDVVPTLHLSGLNKRTRDRDRDQDSQRRISQQDASHVYQRRPRRKTRENRYEYRRPSSPRQRPSRPHKNPNKRTKGRKHALDAAFHAPNVARERLTLRNTRNTGIFRKGRASSPMKFREVPDLAFSENQFLSRNSRGSPGFGTICDGPRMQRQRGEERPHRKVSHYIFREPEKLMDTTPPMLRHGELPAYTSQEDQRDPSGMQDIVLSLHTEGIAAKRSLDNVSSMAPDVQSQMRQPVQGTRSARKLPGSQLSQEMEAHLLNILHVGLSPRRPVTYNVPDASEGGRCNLQDLKGLLESRKAYWLPEASQTLHSFDRVRTRDENRESTPMASGIIRSPTHAKTSRWTSSEAAPKTKSRANLCRLCSGEVFRGPRSHQFHNHKVEVTTDLPPFQRLPLSRVDLKASELDVEEDDIFLETLDAAYGAIFNTQSENLQPFEQKAEEHEASQLALAHVNQNHGNNPPPFSPPGVSSFCGSVDTLLCDQIGVENPYSSFAHLSHHLQEGHATLPDRPFTNTKLPAFSPAERAIEQGTNLTSTTHFMGPFLPPTTAHGSGRGSIPQGFWRPNRLY